MWWKKIVFRNYFLVAAVLAILSAIGIAGGKSFLPSVVPLFYGKPIGAEQLTGYWFFFTIPGMSFLITIINLLISSHVEDEFVKRILAVSSLIISLMAIISVIKIILLVGFF